MFTGKLTDAGTHNSFADTFHRSWNNLNGDLWRSQSDTTITNHVYTGIGLGNVRGRTEEWQTDVPGNPGSYQNAWLWGPGDGTTGLQLWQLQDVLNNVTRFGVQQYTTAGGNNQSFLNAAGTGAVCFNCSTNSGTGGISFGSGGATPGTIAAYDSSGNLYQLGRHDFYSASTLAWRLNCASTSACNIDSETPTANAHHIRLYNGAGTDIDSESTGGVSVNNSTGGGTGPFTVYGGGATYYNTKLFQVQNNGNGTANYLLPSLAAGSGNYCLQADTSGYVTNTGQACGTGSGSGSVTSVGLSLPAQFSVANSPVTNSGTLTATWISQAGHSFLAGLDSSSTGTPAFRAIAADDVPTLNQSTSGNAATATASDHSPTQCSSGLYSQGDTTGWAANCATVQYSQLGGTVPTWNQSTTGNAATATQATNATNVNGGTVSATTGTFSGAVNEPSIVAPASSPATDSASLGPELTTSGTCTGTGWTGTYPTYTPPGTTAPLTCTGFTSGSYYQTVTTLAGNTGGGTLTIVIGTAQVATASSASGVTTAGLKANDTSLTYTPTAALNGTVTISAKLISPITTFSYQGKDSTGALSSQMLLQGLRSLNNLFIGGGGIYNTTGSNNTANGFKALISNTTGNSNTANGYEALFSNTTGNSNTANGYEALYTNTTGYDNTANGFQALFFNTTSSSNTANGYEALYTNTTGSYNTANGIYALFSNTTGGSNTANGFRALYANTTSGNNTANGFQALYTNTTGNYNTANGYEALYTNTTGSSNTANGMYALFSNTTGYDNTANGFRAGQYIADGVTANQTSSNSVYEGYQAYPLANGDTNENVIGNTAIGYGSNTTTLGNSSVTDTYLAGTVHGTSFTGNAATATTTTGNAATATALAAIPGQCSSGNYATGISAAGTANCGAVQYSQLGGTVTTWNQNTTGTAAGITQAASIHIDNSAGANYVCINCDNNTGTSGFVVQNGTGSSPTTEFQVTGSGNTTATGFLASKGWFGNYAATFTAGAAAGSSPTIGCLSGHTCTNIQGTVSILTGTATTTGTIVTVNFNHTQNNDLDCATDFQLAGTGHLTTYDATSSTSGLVIATDGFTPAASTTYTLTYTCGSY